MLRTTLVPLSVPLAFIALAWADFLTTRRAPRLPPPEPLALHAGEEAAMARVCVALGLITAADVLRGEALDPGTSVVTSRALQRDVERRLRSLSLPARECACALALRRSAPRSLGFPALVSSLKGPRS
jgi:hypothetical protein